MNITSCPATLQPGFSTYSPKGRRQLLGGKKVSHNRRLNAVPQQVRDEFMAAINGSMQRLSISGAQEKYRFVLDGSVLRLARADEQAPYILKPISRDLNNGAAAPANEHLTMQIASQVYQIPTAANGLVFFDNDEPAYLTLRFDIRADGSKRRQEDFASLSGRSRQSAGPDFKYKGSYEQVAQLIRQYVPAATIELEKLFRLVVFNYLFANGDAHLKNFSILETDNGDFVLSPAYDLLNTRLHLPYDTDMALKGGLFADDFATESFEANAFYAFDDFLAFGLRIGMLERRIRQQLAVFQVDQPQVRALLVRSFLSDADKATYLSSYESRLQRLRYSFSKNP